MKGTVPDDDRGLLLGDGLFETLRLYEGRPFRLEAHLDRLAAGAAVVGIPVPADLRARVRSAITSADAVLRITLTRGSGWGLAPPESAAGRVVVAVRPLGTGFGRTSVGRAASSAPDRGLSAMLFGRVDERSLVAGLKTTGYLERVQALRLARAEGADEALVRNSRDEVVEGSASNLIAVFGRTIVSPGRASGALPGITRGIVLAEATRLGHSIEERGVGERELAGANEILLTSSVREVVSVVRVGGAPVGNGSPGPVGRSLAAAYREVVRRETSGQVREGPERQGP